MPKRAGAQPSPKKAGGHTEQRSKLTVLPPREELRRVPPLPTRYAPTVRKLWREFWRSSVASAIDPRSDMPALAHWAWCLNELATVTPELEQARIVDGLGGTVALNPLAHYVQHLRASIHHAEIEFGMTPLSRSRLGLTIGQAKLTAQELNRRLRERREPVETVGEWEKEWDL